MNVPPGMNQTLSDPASSTTATKELCRKLKAVGSLGYRRLYWDYIGVILGLYREYIAIQ